MTSPSVSNFLFIEKRKTAEEPDGGR